MASYDCMKNVRQDLVSVICLWPVIMCRMFMMTGWPWKWVIHEDLLLKFRKVKSGRGFCGVDPSVVHLIQNCPGVGCICFQATRDVWSNHTVVVKHVSYILAVPHLVTCCDNKLRLLPFQYKASNSIFNRFCQVMRTGTNQRPLTPGQGQQSQQESLAAAAAANPALAYTGMPGWSTISYLCYTAM